MLFGDVAHYYLLAVSKKDCSAFVFLIKQKYGGIHLNAAVNVLKVIRIREAHLLGAGSVVMTAVFPLTHHFGLRCSHVSSIAALRCS